MSKRILFPSLLSAILASSGLAADNNALIEALVRKKILTKKEAEEIQRDLEEEAEKKEKIKLSKGVTELKLYGDLRLRYQYNNLDEQLPTRPETQQSRWRFRLRLNADFKLTDNWFGGVQLQSNVQSDSGFQTYTGAFRNYDLFISRAFVGWKAADWLTFIVGKQANPFFTTDLLWDPDINPSGVVEQIRFHELFKGEQVNNSADGKTTISARKAPRWELTLIAGQFFFSDNSDVRLPSAYLFEQQLLFRYKFENDIQLTVAPAYLTYNPAKVTLAENVRPFTRETDGLPDWVLESANLSLFQLPGDVRFKISEHKFRFLWDFVYNSSGGKRMHDTYRIANRSSRDDFAFLVGFQIGENEKKGNWSFYLNYREIGMASIDPNLNDSDWGLSRLNLRGFKGSLAYNFTDFAVASISYNSAWNLRKNLIGGQATEGARLADANAVQVLQVELNVKF